MPYKTFVYSPEVRCVIEGLDVSADLLSGSVNRVVDGASSLRLTISNKDFRYTRDHQFRRMDRVVVWMRRVGQPIKVFTGYLNVVPGIQLYPSTVVLEASCTIKRLLYTYWDPGLDASKLLLDQHRIPWGEHPEGGTASSSDTDADADADADDPDNATPDDEVPAGSLGPILDGVDVPDQTVVDGAEAGDMLGPGLVDAGDTGLAMMLMNILTKVGGWDPDTVKIERFPEPFFKTVLAYMPEDIQGMDVKGMEKIRDMFDFYEKISGSGSTVPGQLGPITASQLEHAKEIRRAASDLGLDPLDDACIIGYMVGLQESGIRILANPAVPASMSMANEGTGTDHDSVGIFQQRDNGAWGTLEERMNAYGSARLFYNALRGFNWQSMPKGAAGQKVQGSAYPDAYDKWEPQAKEILAQVKSEDPDVKGVKDSGGGLTSVVPGVGDNPQTKKPGPTKDTSKVKDPNAPDTAGMRINDAIEAIVMWKFPDTFTGERGLNSAFSKDRFTDNGLHAQARACDISNGGDAGTPEMFALATWWYENYLGKGLQELIYAHFNHNVGHDQDVGDGMGSYYGPGTMADHRNHVHIGMSAVPSPDGTTDGPSLSGGAGGAAGIQWENNLAKNLFTYLFEPERFNDDYSEMLTGKHASLNDQPLINIVRTLCEARMCHFQSGPDGTFNAFYPDYFGLDGTSEAVTLEDIEIKDFTISINDNALTTHVFTIGSQGPDKGSVIQEMDGYMTSPGVVTIEDDWLFRLATQEMAFRPESYDSGVDEFLGRYGIRPFRDQPYSNINSGDNPAAMLVVALKVFMEKWAEQYETEVQLTFMPELFPGMRIILANHNLAVYVKSVSHSFSYESGFTTSCRVMAPMQPRTQEERAAMWSAIINSAPKRDDPNANSDTKGDR